MPETAGYPTDTGSSPLVSIVIPCRNEKEYVGRCLNALVSGTVQAIEVIVVDGLSEDGTTEIVSAFAQEDGRVKLLLNPSRVTPVALNLGIRAASAPSVAILGAHSEPTRDWAEKSLTALAEHPQAAAVGGVLETVGEGFWGKAVAAALSSPFGVGNARFRSGGRPGRTDTVVFGCYRRDIFQRSGLFDENFTTNQDDEFNIRLLAHGEELYFDPAIKCRYYARPSWKKVLSQYWRYGRFKFGVFHKNRRIGSLRQVAPAGWVALLVIACAGGPFLPVLRTVALWFVTAYVALGVMYTARGLRRFGFSAIMLLAIAASMHISYGLGTWWGAAVTLVKRASRAHAAVLPERAA